jgi:hypothetical protein
MLGPGLIARPAALSQLQHQRAINTNVSFLSRRVGTVRIGLQNQRWEAAFLAPKTKYFTLIL